MMTFQAFLTMIPVACAIIVFVWNMKRTFHNASSKQNFIEEAKKDGRTAKAELVDTWITSGSSSSDGEARYSKKHALYLYRVDGKKYIKGLYHTIMPGEHHIFHDTETVYYQKGNPKKAITAGEAGNSEKMERGCLVSFLYAFAVLAALIWIFKWLGFVG